MRQFDDVWSKIFFDIIYINFRFTFLELSCFFISLIWSKWQAFVLLKLFIAVKLYFVMILSSRFLTPKTMANSFLLQKSSNYSSSHPKEVILTEMFHYYRGKCKPFQKTNFHYCPNENIQSLNLEFMVPSYHRNQGAYDKR